MKFYLLPIGEKFKYQGETYIKAGPLTASSETKGSNKLIPRSANITSVNESDSAIPKVIKEHQIQTSKVLEEFDTYHHYCLDCFSELSSEVNPEIIKSTTERLEIARQTFIETLLK